MRVAAFVAACLSVVGLAAENPARASIRRTLNIPAQGLESALQELGKDLDRQIVYRTQVIDTKTTEGVSGTLTFEEALTEVLSGTALTYFYLDDKTVTIVPTSVGTNAGLDTASTELGTSKPTDVSAQSIALWEQLHLAQTTGTTFKGDQSAATTQISQSEAAQLEEVLVTAQKKGEAERLQDVPVPISVISAQALMQSNQFRIQEYFDQVPGLSVAESGSGLSMVSIRGITTGPNTNPTVGFTLDDVPLGGSTEAVNEGQIPTINPADLAQVEVLRGPQGTLYGDNSMGGLIRYVTVDPSTDRVFGDVRVGGDTIFNGIHLGYSTSAAINVPLTDVLAARLSAFTRFDPGYVTDIRTGENGIASSKAGGGRISAKWTPSEDLSLKLSGLYEKTDRYGSPDVDVPTARTPETIGLGDLQQYAIRGSGSYSQDFKTTNLTINANLGGVKVTSVSGYTVSQYTATLDYSLILGTPASEGSPLLERNELHKFTQEVRLADTIGSDLEWMLGGFYSQEDNLYFQSITTTDLNSGLPATVSYDSFYNRSPGRFREYAGFGALTWKVTDAFDVQFGGRESYLNNPPIDEGSYFGGSLLRLSPGPSVYNPPVDTQYKTNAFTYLVSPRFKLTPDIMIYARVANGFRPGSGTTDPAPTAGCVLNHTPCAIYPDKTTNYEVGAKADFFHHSLSVDSSVYYIKWSDLQVELVNPTTHLNFGGNGAGAKSQGIDLSMQWKPLDGLTISTWGAWDQAVVTQDFANGAAGQPLPFSARFSGNFTVEKDFLITGDLHAFFLGKEIYVGERLGSFTALSKPRQNLPAYSQTDLSAGVRDSQWTFNAYVNNATDRRGLLYGGLGNADGAFAFDYITPRTIGISVEKAF